MGESKSQNYEYETPKGKYRCMCCEKMKSTDEFYSSRYSRVWNSTNKTVMFCKGCIDIIFAEYAAKHGEITALGVVCAMLDWVFSVDIYNSASAGNTPFTLGIYYRNLNTRPNRHKTFVTSIAEGHLRVSDVGGTADDSENDETGWKKEDKQNRRYVVSLLGYDPFDDAILSDSDRRFLYNTMSGYCSDDSVTSDNHKVQCIIQITQTLLQCKRIDDFLNIEMSNSDIDDGKVKVLTTTKKQLLDSISTLAKDNNLSSNYSTVSKRGMGTLSQKMADLAKDNFEGIQVNLFDIKTSAAMKQVADLSNRSIMEQLSLDANDYTEMIKEQRELIVGYDRQVTELEEANRLLRNKVIDLEKLLASAVRE